FAPEDLLAMERVKEALDPQGLANRGKVLPEGLYG
ncbi:FAD-linked oxidase C-terminal domain-containing protein, partial [Acinetobacter baumannii]